MKTINFQQTPAFNPFGCNSLVTDIGSPKMIVRVLRAKSCNFIKSVICEHVLFRSRIGLVR